MNNLDQMTIDGYFAAFSHFHVKKATDLLQPLHTPGRDPLLDFSFATRHHGFLGGGAGFTGIAFGAAAFLGFFFSLLCALLPLPIVIASIRE
jgi:hypothetical protein